MSNSAPEKPLRTGQWSDEEKMKFLFQFVLQQPKLDWKAITLPPGRDITSCRNMIAAEKRKWGITTPASTKVISKTNDGYSSHDGFITPNAGAADTASPFGTGDTSGAATPTPTKKKAAARKRKSAGADVGGEGGNHDNGGAATGDASGDEKPKKKRGPKPKTAAASANAVDAAAGGYADPAEAAEDKPMKKRVANPKVKKEDANSEGNHLPEVHSSKVKQFDGTKPESLFGPNPTASDNDDEGQEQA